MIKKVVANYDYEKEVLSWVCPRCKQKYNVPPGRDPSFDDMSEIAREAGSRCIRCGTEYYITFSYNVIKKQQEKIKMLTKILKEKKNGTPKRNLQRL